MLFYMYFKMCIYDAPNTNRPSGNCKIRKVIYHTNERRASAHHILQCSALCFIDAPRSLSAHIFLCACNYTQRTLSSSSLDARMYKYFIVHIIFFFRIHQTGWCSNLFVRNNNIMKSQFSIERCTYNFIYILYINKHNVHIVKEVFIWCAEFIRVASINMRQSAELKWIWLFFFYV